MDSPTRERWLAERRQGIGSSDVAAICGLSPWGSPLSVYLDKVGLLPDKAGAQLDWGQRLEPVIARAYEDARGSLLTPGKLFRHREYPFLLATPDYLPLNLVSEPCIVECKNTRSSEGWGEEGTDQVPRHYLVQVQHQCHVLGIERAEIAVLIGGQDFRIYHVPYSRELYGMIFPILQEFWQRVENQDPPPPDWQHPDTPKLVERLYRPEASLSVSLTPSTQAMVDAWQSLGAQITGLNHERERLRAQIIEQLGFASQGLLPDGREVVRKQVNRKAYSVPACTYVDFRIRERKEI